MARLPRLDLAGQLHLVMQYARAAQPAFVDDEDRRRYLAALLESTRECALALHAYVLLDDQVLLLATPSQPHALADCIQAVGRRYVKAFNHRHQRRGPIWEGRYRSTVVDADQHLLDCLRLVEQAPVRQGLVAQADDWPWSSAAHHAGRRRDALVTEHAAYWALGNTPFEREALYARKNAVSLEDERAKRLLAAAHNGWPVGSDAFLQALAQRTARPLQPRQRGRPPKANAI